MNNYKWGQIKLERLSNHVEVERLKHPKSIEIDEPILPGHLSYDSHLNDSLDSNKISHEIEPGKIATEISYKNQREQKIKLYPNIDSYVINTIKLNQLLKENFTFDQIDAFFKSKKKKGKIVSEKANKNKQKNLPKNKKTTTIITHSNESARSSLWQFVVVMSLHAGFDVASSIALDTLVDVLEHFIESFFKLLKNLRSIQQFDPSLKEKPLASNQGFYSSPLFIHQAFEESGIGTVQELKEFYMNDILNYYRQTFKKVNKLYEEYKRKGQGISSKNENDLKLDEFMKDNDFLNDESSSILGELLTDLNGSHLGEELNKLIEIIGPDPLSFIGDEFETNQLNI